MINVDVKIGSRAIAKRLEKTLPSIVHYDQYSHVKGKTIFDAVRTIEDVLDFSKAKNLSGLLITIYFQNSIRFCAMGFSYKVIHSVQFLIIIYIVDQNVLQNVSNSRVINNGFSTGYFRVVLHHWRLFFSIRFEFQGIRKGCEGSGDDS